MDIEFLEELGFTRTEIDVYLGLLELGSTTTGPLVTESGASSSKIYEILGRLIDKGMASYVLEGNIKHFSAAPPARILDYIQRQQEELEEQKERTESLLPQLQAMHHASKKRQEAKIYRGFQGLKAAFDEALAHMPDASTAYVYGVPDQDDARDAFYKGWNKKRAARGIKMKIMFNAQLQGDKQARQDEHELAEIRFHPPTLETPAGVNILGDTVLLNPAQTAKDALVISITDSRVAESFKAQFETFWNQTTRTLVGLDGPRIVLKETVESKEAEKMIALDGNKYLEHLPDEVDSFVDRMRANGQQMQLLFSESTSPTPLAADHTHVRFLPDEYVSPAHVQIYGNHVALIDWTEPITTVIIDKPELAKRYHKYFDTLWSAARKAHATEVAKKQS